MQPRLALNVTYVPGDPVGEHLTRADALLGRPPTPVNGVFAVLQRDATHPDGYTVLTSYPVPYDDAANAVRERYPNLYQLFGAYLHQDWSNEFETADAAVAAFASEANALRPRAAKELTALLRTAGDEELPNVLDALLCSYAYEADGYSARGWLEHVHTSILRKR